MVKLLSKEIDDPMRIFDKTESDELILTIVRTDTEEPMVK